MATNITPNLLGESKGIEMTLRVVTLYDRTRVQPDTLDGIAAAGGPGKSPTIGVDKSELDCFTQLWIYKPIAKDEKRYKSVILCNKRGVSPDTVEAIEKAPNGACIPVDPVELDAFFPMVLHIPSLKRVGNT
jgi:hypothetical protein